MLPYYESQRSQRRDDRLGRPAPDPIRIMQEIFKALRSRARWVLPAALLLTLGFAAAQLWPEESVRAEMDFTALQDATIRGSVESITISGTSAEGSFHGTVSAYEGEIVGIGQPVPDGVYSSDDMDQANAFFTTIPAEAKDSFIDLSERQGVEVTVE